ARALEFAPDAGDRRVGGVLVAHYAVFHRQRLLNSRRLADSWPRQLLKKRRSQSRVEFAPLSRIGSDPERRFSFPYQYEDSLATEGAAEHRDIIISSVFCGALRWLFMQTAYDSDSRPVAIRRGCDGRDDEFCRGRRDAGDFSGAGL